MPKMTHWNSREIIDVPPERAAVFQDQGWVPVEKSPKSAPPAVTTAAVDEPAPAEKPVKKAAAKKPAKKTASKK